MHERALAAVQERACEVIEGALAALLFTAVAFQSGLVIECLRCYKPLEIERGWFTEGFDTADLKDAKALLDELAEEILREA